MSRSSTQYGMNCDSAWKEKRIRAELHMPSLKGKSLYTKRSNTNLRIQVMDIWSDVFQGFVVALQVEGQNVKNPL